VQEQVTHIRKAAALGETVRMETVRLHVDGRLIPVSITVYPVIVGTNPVGFWSIYVDLSERVRTERILQERENRLRDYAHAVPDMSFVVDEDGQYVEVFGNVEKMSGKSQEEIQGYSLHDLFPHDIAQLFLSIVQEVIASGHQSLYPGDGSQQKSNNRRRTCGSPTLYR
jgi:PAS domain-containing protein